MTVALCTQTPKIVKYGGAREERYAYVDGEVYNIGDLVRISTTGTVELAEANSAGAVHAIALSDGTTGETTVPVLMLASDTVIAIQAEDGKTPADYDVGSIYTLLVTAGLNGLVDVTTNGVAMVVDKPATDQPWADTTGTYDVASDTANGLVYVRIIQSVLDGTVAV
jgi:hypothetical protein